ncbi:phosphatase PAP2 family protein [Streptomyces sp. NBC_00102]|uniref:phosphatase PAP2 family protein n=1 Tax=Streptomyces sp. NBC_00102 TaxID=2975652 RepID=UPI00224D8764|nr:phosphatase PAP2 family protein [Streptomyces sp. NBC_00102]MCX5401750.1 phosphatase PAP2 family protein [Streptomyces sp. NBC_00102]
MRAARVLRCAPAAWFALPGRGRRVTGFCVLGGVALAALTAAVTVGGGGPDPLDAGIRALALEHRPAPLVAVLRAVTATGTGPTPYLVALAAGLMTAPALDPDRGRRPAVRFAAPAAAFALWLACGQALRLALMTAVARPRPPAEDWLTHASRWAFPSGHATTSAMAAGLVVVALLARRPPAFRSWAGLAVLWAASVGISRVWLGVHWAGDVAAGWFMALVWTGLGVVLVARATPLPGPACR